MRHPVQMIICGVSSWMDDHALSAASPAPTLPPLPCETCPLQQPLRDAQWQAAYDQARHQRARQREDQLQQPVAELQAEIRDLRHRLFGRKTETHHPPDILPPDGPSANGSGTPPDDPTAAVTEPPRRRRGQQRGAKGHGRRDYAHRPTTEEWRDLPDDQCRCQRCGQPFAPFPGTDDTTILEGDVKAHRRRIRRRR
jgi:transposase